EAGIVVKLGRLVQPQRHVQPGADEFARINGARLQRRDDIAHWQGHHDSSEALQHLSTGAGHAITQPLKCLDTGCSFVNQPPIWAPVLPQSSALRPNPALSSSQSAWPPPK